MNWYYAHNGQQQGPVSEAEIVKLFQAGTISPTSLVWKDGLPDWQPLSTALPSALTGGAAAPLAQIGGVDVPAERKDVFVQQMREGVAAALPGTLEFAGFWIRFVAKFIDGLVMMVPGLLIQGAAAALVPGGLQALTPTPGAEPTPPTPEQIASFASALGLVMVLSIGVNLLYNALMVSKYGATLGKMALGLKVINEDRTKVGFGKAVGRFFAEIVSGMVCYIGYIMAAFDSEKRSLHDQICSTRVIKTR